MQKVFVCLSALILCASANAFMEVYENQMWHTLTGSGRGFTPTHDAPHDISRNPYCFSLGGNEYKRLPISGEIGWQKTDTQFISTFRVSVDTSQPDAGSMGWNAKWHIQYFVSQPVLVESFFINANHPDWTRTGFSLFDGTWNSMSDPYTAEPRSKVYHHTFSGSGSFGTSPYHEFKIVMTVIPEPATLLLFGLGATAILKKRRRKQPVECPRIEKHP